MSVLHVEAAGHGPPLVLLHGWALDSGLWGELPATLARRHRVHAVDLPGHGHSPPLVPLTVETLVRALDQAFVSEPEPLTVLGWSLGGQLVLVATTPKFVAGDDWNCAMPGATLERFGDELVAAWRATVLRFLTLQTRG